MTTEIILTLLFLGQPDPNPLRMDEGQAAIARMLVERSALRDDDPYEMLAIAWVESRMDPRASSPTGDFGLLQVNCKIWHDELGYSDQADCIINMFDALKNEDASRMILRTYRNYRGCRGWNIYACYNGGPGWRQSENRERIEKYRKRIAEMKWFFRRYYGEWVLVQQKRIGSSLVCIYR